MGTNQRKFGAEKQAKSKVKKVHLRGKMDEVEGSSLKKYVEIFSSKSLKKKGKKSDLE